MNRDTYPPRFTPAGTAPELSLAGYLPAKPRLREATSAPPVAPTPPLAVAAALERLEELVDRENRALVSREALDFADLNRRKSQSLLEVTRLSRTLPPDGKATLGTQLGRLRDKLVDNHRALGLHVAAVREISDLMVQSLAEAESDGTYGMTRNHRKAPR